MAPDVLEIDPEGDLIIEIPDLARTVLDKQAGGGGNEPDIDRTPESVPIGLSVFFVLSVVITVERFSK